MNHKQMLNNMIWSYVIEQRTNSLKQHMPDELVKAMELPEDEYIQIATLWIVRDPSDEELLAFGRWSKKLAEKDWSERLDKLMQVE